MRLIFLHILWLIDILVLICHFRLTLACTDTVQLTEFHGIIKHPESDETYSANTDLCWLIVIEGSIAIEFHMLDLEDKYDKIQIYEDTSRPVESKERFRLSKPAQVANSEFWLTGRKTLIRFTSDGSVEKTGFRLKYRKIPAYGVPVAGPPAAVKVISGALSGVIDSHAEFESSKNYSDSVLQAWSILAQPSELVRVKFAAFNTEKNFDFLRIFFGVLPSVQSNSMFVNMSGELGNKMDYSFFGSVTFVFNSDGSTQGKGFRFMYDVIKTDYSLQSVFHQWNGGVGTADAGGGGDTAFSLIARPADVGLEARCSVRKECTSRFEMFALPSDSVQLYNETRLRFRLRPRKGDSNSFYCVGAILCHVSWKTEAYRNIEQSLDLPTQDPKSVTIHLVRPELWSQTGLVRFLAVSESVCPRVRHRCELRTANGSTLKAQLIKVTVSPTTPPSCVSSSVRTLFATHVPDNFDAATTIACRLNDGGFLEHSVPALDPAADQGAQKSIKPWERPMHGMAWLAAGIAIILLVVVLLRNARNRRKRHGLIKTSQGKLKLNEQHESRDVTGGRNNSYINTPHAIEERVNEVYVT